MALQRQILINNNGNSVTFDPPVFEAKIGDQIFWTNNDDKPHWPGLPADGEVPANDTFFMRNQIAPGALSVIFSPSLKDTFVYVCSLHPGETGTIEIT